MFAKLALRNVRRQIRNYLIYFVTVSLSIALLFAVSNVLLVRVLSTTLLFLLDVAVWTVMHCIITIRINALRRAYGSPDGQP